MNLQSILSEREKTLKKELIKDFNNLYKKGFSTDWEAQRFVRATEIEIMKLDNLLSFHAETARLVWESALSAVQEAVEKMKGCRFGCFCSLCGLCDEETSIHCGDCVMGKPMSALSSVSERIGELRKKIKP